MKRKIMYIDMDNVLCNYDFSYLKYKKKFQNIEYPQSMEGFFLNLEPIEGSIETVKKIISSDIYDPYVLTAPSTHNPISYMEKRIWIENYFDYNFTKKLIISSNKGLLKGDFLIDDNIEGKGQENFEGKIIHFGSSEFPNWQAVDKLLFCSCFLLSKRNDILNDNSRHS